MEFHICHMFVLFSFHWIHSQHFLHVDQLAIFLLLFFYFLRIQWFEGIYCPCHIQEFLHQLVLGVFCRLFLDRQLLQVCFVERIVFYYFYNKLQDDVYLCLELVIVIWDVFYLYWFWFVWVLWWGEDAIFLSAFIDCGEYFFEVLCVWTCLFLQHCYQSCIYCNFDNFYPIF